LRALSKLDLAIACRDSQEPTVTPATTPPIAIADGTSPRRSTPRRNEQMSLLSRSARGVRASVLVVRELVARWKTVVAAP
jgi:hypothetical protein